MTEIWMDNVRVEKLQIFTDEIGFFLRGTTADGKRFETTYAKGTA
jgi:hypothetical protein